MEKDGIPRMLDYERIVIFWNLLGLTPRYTRKCSQVLLFIEL
jgi:hypothetical protein